MVINASVLDKIKVVLVGKKRYTPQIIYFRQNWALGHSRGSALCTPFALLRTFGATCSPLQKCRESQGGYGIENRETFYLCSSHLLLSVFVIIFDGDPLSISCQFPASRSISSFLWCLCILSGTFFVSDPPVSLLSDSLVEILVEFVLIDEVSLVRVCCPVLSRTWETTSAM